MKQTMQKHVNAAAKQKPRLLLVDDIDIALPQFAQTLEDLGFEVIKMHLDMGMPISSDDSTIMRVQNVGEITKYALNSANRISAVLTDLNGPRKVPYGLNVVQELAKCRFNGVVAVHSDQSGDKKDLPDAIGKFDKAHLDETAAAIQTALQAKGRAAG